MSGAGLSLGQSGKALLGKPAFQPYRGKRAARNDREDRGNVGIIRRPSRASILPESCSPCRCTAVAQGALAAGITNPMSSSGPNSGWAIKLLANTATHTGTTRFEN